MEPELGEFLSTTLESLYHSLQDEPSEDEANRHQPDGNHIPLIALCLLGCSAGD